MNTKPVSNDTLLNQLRWRYATKQFDTTRKISSADWQTLEESLRLTPSSFGLQPWKFIVVTDPVRREKLVGASWDQRQVAEASHLVVFAIKENIGERDIDAFVNRISEVRGAPLASLAGYRDMMVGSLVKSRSDAARKSWATNQVYIALGNFLTSAALLGIDTCPMEGIVPAQYDEILGLAGSGYQTAVVAVAGYRAKTDKYATLPKVRFAPEELIAHVD